MAAIGAIPADALAGFTVLGELALDGSVTPVAGVLPAAIGANARGQGLVGPAACGAEAAWASRDIDILAPRSLIQLANHFKGTQVMARPEPAVAAGGGELPDLKDIKGQESGKRTLEIAAAGGHNLLTLYYIDPSESSRGHSGDERLSDPTNGFDHHPSRACYIRVRTGDCTEHTAAAFCRK